MVCISKYKLIHEDILMYIKIDHNFRVQGEDSIKKFSIKKTSLKRGSEKVQGFGTLVWAMIFNV